MCATSSRLLLLMVVFAGCCAVEYRNRAYEGLVVTIDDSVPKAECGDVLTNLQDTLRDTSRNLLEAMDSRAYIRSVTIVLPMSWPDSCAPTAVMNGYGEKSDITVIPKDPVRGRVWTEQYGGCGEPGEQIYLGYESLKLPDDTLGWSLVKEFAKYRYGVFSEEGFRGDPLYPACYLSEQPSPKVTGCSDFPIKEENSVCNDDFTTGPYNVSAMVDGEKARRSIMFAAEAPMVTRFCEDGNHDPFAPTKHNFMCNRRSVSDVIFKHADFFPQTHEEDDMNMNSLEGNNREIDTAPVFIYKRQKLTRYVLVVDGSTEMIQRESTKFLRSAVKHWVTYLPQGTEIAAIRTSEQSAVTQMNFTVEANTLSYSIPGSSSISTACTVCGIELAVKMLADRTALRGPATSVIIVIAPGLSYTNRTALDQTLSEAKANHIRIVTLNYPSIYRSGPLDMLSKQTNGQSYTVYERKQNNERSLVSTYFNLTNVFRGIATEYFTGDKSRIPVEVHRKELSDDKNLRNSVKASFVIEPEMGEPAQFLVFAYDIENPLIDNIKLVSPSGIEYTARSDSMDQFKLITVKSNINETGTWSYSLDRDDGNPQPHYVQVFATPGSSRSDVIHAKFWVRRTAKGAVIMYCKVTKGRWPVMEALVNVVVTKVSDGNDTSSPGRNSYSLWDNGNGDPDVTKNDGIYSRYFDIYHGGPGIYNFEATVSDNANAYSWNSDSLTPQAPNSPCCGHSVPSPSKLQVSFFRRHISPVISLHISPADMQDLTRPLISRIGDLRAEPIPRDRSVRLRWTSPDAGSGRVSRYEIRYVTSLNETDKFPINGNVWEQDRPMPLSAGSESSVLLNFEKNLLDTPLYFAVKAFSAEVQGQFSNWARVYLSSPPPPPTVPPTNQDQLPSWPYDDVSSNGDSMVPRIAKASNLGVELVLPIVVGVVFLAIILSAYCYFCIVKRRGNPTAKKNPNSAKNNDKLNSTLTMSPNGIMPQTPQHHDLHSIGVPIGYNVQEDEPKKRYSIVNAQEQQLIEELKQQQQQQQMMNGYSGVSIISNNTLQRVSQTMSPISWTPSQLLYEHERRHSPMEEIPQDMMLEHSLSYDQTGRVHPPPVPPLPSYNGYPPNYAIYGVHPSQGYHRPDNNGSIAAFNPSLQGSMSSVNSGEKKRRNVTMV